jgi:hypothetical protein
MNWNAGLVILIFAAIVLFVMFMHVIIDLLKQILTAILNIKITQPADGGVGRGGYLYRIVNNLKIKITMGLSITDTEQIELNLQVTDAKGAATSPKAGSVLWTIDDTTVGTIVDNPAFPGDETKKLCKGGVPGVTKVTCAFDGNNDGVGDPIPVSLFAALEVLPSDGTAGSIAGGAVTPQ